MWFWTHSWRQLAALQLADSSEIMFVICRVQWHHQWHSSNQQPLWWNKSFVNLRSTLKMKLLVHSFYCRPLVCISMNLAQAYVNTVTQLLFLKNFVAIQSQLHFKENSLKLVRNSPPCWLFFHEVEKLWSQEEQLINLVAIQVFIPDHYDHVEQVFNFSLVQAEPLPHYV